MAIDYGWKPDASKEPRLTFTCAADNPRRCQGRCRERSLATGKDEQCRRMALRGTTPPRCQYHGGRRMLRDAGQPTVNRLPSFYRNKLHPRLQEFVDFCLDHPAHEQYSLNEELALARDNVAAIEQTLAIAIDLPEDKDVNGNVIITGPRTKLKELLIAQSRAMRDSALKSVREMAATAAAIDNGTKDKISVHHISHIVKQITKFAYEAFGDTKEARAFEKKLSEEIRIPGEIVGTDITPDMQVTAMDDTIPAAPPPGVMLEVTLEVTPEPAADTIPETDDYAGSDSVG